MANYPSRCHHIKVNGTQCGSPALRRHTLCYFHQRHHEESIALNTDRLKNARASRRNVTIDLPVLEDANSIQISLMQIMRLIITGQIDAKTAGLLLYALQTASANLRRTNFEHYNMHDVVLDPKTVAETPLDAHIWEDSDFITEEEDEEMMRAQALEEAQRQAKKKAELKRWAEAEADRIAAAGALKRAAELEDERRRDARFEADLQRDQQRTEQAALQYKAMQDARFLAAISPAGHAQLPPPSTPTPKSAPTPTATSPGKRPPAKVNIPEVRERIRAQIRKALPDITAALSARENGKSTG